VVDGQKTSTRQSTGAFDCSHSLNMSVTGLTKNAERFCRAVSQPRRRAHLICCAAVLLCTALYFGPLILRGWVPFDEGTLAQSAHRILLGQLPHRDFDEGYTGGLSLAHAAAFRLFGENLVTMRLLLFGAILLVVPAVYYIASRFTSPLSAAGVSIAVLLGSFASYPAPMPSWYNLIFALFGCAALLRYLESEKTRWVFAAGCCAGLSVLVKIIGVYFIAAGGLFLIFNAFASPLRDGRSAFRSTGSAMIAMGLTGFIAAGPFVVMHGRLRLIEVVELGMPVVAVCIAVGIEVWRASGRTGGAETPPMLGWTIAAFAVGVLVPIVSLILVYAAADALPSLYRGLIVLPQKRVNANAEDGPALLTMVLGLPPLLALTSSRLATKALRCYDLFLVIALEVTGVIWSMFSLKVTAALWNAVRMAAPAIIVAGVVTVAASPSANGTLGLRRRQALVLVAAAALCALVQYPTDSYQYFLYALPLFLLAAVAIAALRGALSRGIARATLLAFIVLGLLLRPNLIAHGGGASVVLIGQPTAKLDLDRGGITVRRAERDEYVRLVTLIQQHSRSRFIYASPDAPEVYFLAERENPSRVFFEAFSDETDHKPNRILSDIRDRGIDVAVINNRPRFSPELPAGLRDSLRLIFPHASAAGQFEVRWR
jgi:hypothetical protein